MPTTNDPDYFFQTSQSLVETERKAAKSKNNNGSPIHLPSKILAVIRDPNDSNAVYVAESAGTARRIQVETRETSHIYRGPATPLTSLTLSSNGETLYAGSWDKSVWSWSTRDRKPGRRLQGHADFVKTVLHLRLNATEILLSGGADATIVVWDISTGVKLFTLKGHARGILTLAIDPTTYDPRTASGDIVVFSGSSDPHIRRWTLKGDLSAASEVGAENGLLQHETSVNALRFDEDDDLWTASSDGTAKCLSRERGWEADTTLEHDDYVRDVMIDEVGGWIVTVGRNEEVKIWERGNGKLWHTYSGHFEEITGCVLLPGQKLVTVSIDRTVRQWPLRTDDLGKARKEVEDHRKGVELEQGTPAEEKGAGLTEEEERELAELMEDD